VSKDVVKVFISHKSEDKETALFLHRKVELYGGDRVDCFVSEKIPYGADWFSHIRSSLADTRVLIFLFTVTNATWDWPLYEVGLATDLNNCERCKIVCLHPPHSKPPEPIKYAQAVQASPEGIEDFLYKFFCTSEITGADPPINARFRDDKSELTAISREIARGFSRSQPWSYCFTSFLWVIANPPIPLEREEVPEDARIEDESSALEMFGLTRKPPGRPYWTWGDLLRRVGGESDLSWVRELGERFYWASRGEVLKTTKSVFRCLKTDRLHRPLLHRAELRADGTMLFEVIFVVHLTDDEIATERSLTPG
jgi:hypothetical protein